MPLSMLFVLQMSPRRRVRCFWMSMAWSYSSKCSIHSVPSLMRTGYKWRQKSSVSLWVFTALFTVETTFTKLFWWKIVNYFADLVICPLQSSHWYNKYLDDKISLFFEANIDMGTCGPVDRALDSRSEGVRSQCWLCIEVLGKLRIPHCLGPPSHNGYLVHRSKVGSIVAGCIGAHLARGKVKSVEYALLWCLNSKQLPLPFKAHYSRCSL